MGAVEAAAFSAPLLRRCGLITSGSNRDKARASRDEQSG
jgi:hypothetical protein